MTPRAMPTHGVKLRLRGAGDVVALVAEPAKRAILAAFPCAAAWLARCGCAQRQAGLNHWMPFSKP